MISDELQHNATAYFLATLGLLVVGIAEVKHLPATMQVGRDMAAAALLAFQWKRQPQPGIPDPMPPNTTATVQTTVTTPANQDT